MSSDVETSHDTASCNLLGAPAPASARARIIALSKAWSEERAVRNWNEGLVGELTPELQTLVECMREAEANQISALVDDGLCDALLGRLRQCPPAVERDWIKRALIAAYAACQSQRSSMRLAFGSEVSVRLSLRGAPAPARTTWQSPHIDSRPRKRRLEAIHDVGFCFGDLKPENVLLTGAGLASGDTP